MVHGLGCIVDGLRFKLSGFKVQDSGFGVDC